MEAPLLVFLCTTLQREIGELKPTRDCSLFPSLSLSLFPSLSLGAGGGLRSVQFLDCHRDLVNIMATVIAKGDLSPSSSPPPPNDLIVRWANAMAGKRNKDNISREGTCSPSLLSPRRVYDHPDQARVLIYLDVQINVVRGCVGEPFWFHLPIFSYFVAFNEI